MCHCEYALVLPHEQIFGFFFSVFFVFRANIFEWKKNEEEKKRSRIIDLLPKLIVKIHHIYTMHTDIHIHTCWMKICILLSWTTHIENKIEFFFYLGTEKQHTGSKIKFKTKKQNTQQTLNSVMLSFWIRLRRLTDLEWWIVSVQNCVRFFFSTSLFAVCRTVDRREL